MAMGSGPKVVLATCQGMDYGMARELLLRWGSQPQNAVIFTQQPRVRLKKRLLLQVAGCGVLWRLIGSLDLSTCDVLVLLLRFQSAGDLALAVLTAPGFATVCATDCLHKSLCRLWFGGNYLVWRIVQLEHGSLVILQGCDLLLAVNSLCTWPHMPLSYILCCRSL